MNQSESIAALSAALSKAQAIMEGASKDSSNPFFKSKYADLSAVWDACRKPLTDNGLSVVQTADFIPEHPDMVCIETILCHSSGEWIKGRLAVKPVKPDPQSVGSCITYLRRYSLQSIVGIAPEDDDGNAASGKKDEAPAQKKPSPKPPVSAPVEKEYPEFTEPEKDHLPVGTELRTRVDGMIADNGIDAKEFKAWLASIGKIGKKYGNPSLSTMSIEAAENMVKKWDATVKAFNLYVDKKNAA